MNPWAMSAMFNSFNLDNRYMLFGLNINRSTGSWGCLSNVGLILHDFSFSGFTGASPDWKWHFEHLMPSSLNMSVCELLAKVLRSMDTSSWGGKTPKGVANDLVKIIIAQTDGLYWGQYKTTDDEDNPDSLVSQLFGELEGKTIGRIVINGIVLDPGTLIDSKAKLGLNPLNSDLLEYFDPGLVPSDTGESPKDELRLNVP